MGLFSRKGSSSDKRNGSNVKQPNGIAKSPTIQPTTTNGTAPTRPMTSHPDIPDIPLPKAPDPYVDPAAYLRSIYAVRERSQLVFEKAKKNQLNHFTVDMSKFADTASYVVSIIKRDYAPDYTTIPPHGRWQHFEAGGRPRISELLSSWPTIDAQERTRRLLDLFLISVLLDAGAGAQWRYRSVESGKTYRRSEGLAIASLEMFKAGLFSSVPGEPCRVDAGGLRRLTVKKLGRGLQVGEGNGIDGLEGRTGVLIRLAEALVGNQGVYGREGRVGNMLDYLLSHPTTHASSIPIIPLPTLWDTLMTTLLPIWPAQGRTTLYGAPLGDAWPLPTLEPSHPHAQDWESIVPFHKLTQWLAYSLMTPMTRLLSVRWAGAELLTGLPEYRNGGLLVDTGLLTLKEWDARRGLEAYWRNAQVEGQPCVEVVPMFEVNDPVVVEWRAVTVGFLDELRQEVNRLLGLDGGVGREGLSLAQVLEAGTWKGGREIAEVSRPNTKEPPIMILSDGTVF